MLSRDRWRVTAGTVCLRVRAPGPGAHGDRDPARARPARAPASPGAEVIAARMGLTKAPGYVAYTAATDPNHLLGSENGYTSKVSWGPDGGTGTIEVFPDQAGAIARQDYIKGFTCRSASAISPWRAPPTCALGATSPRPRPPPSRRGSARQPRNSRKSPPRPSA